MATRLLTCEANSELFYCACGCGRLTGVARVQTYRQAERFKLIGVERIRVTRRLLCDAVDKGRIAASSYSQFSWGGKGGFACSTLNK